MFLAKKNQLLKMDYDITTIILWRFSDDFKNMITFLECCLQLEIDSEDLQTCQE